MNKYNKAKISCVLGLSTVFGGVVSGIAGQSYLNEDALDSYSSENSGINSEIRKFEQGIIRNSLRDTLASESNRETITRYESIVADREIYRRLQDEEQLDKDFREEADRVLYKADGCSIEIVFGGLIYTMIGLIRLTDNLPKLQNQNAKKEEGK